MHHLMLITLATEPGETSQEARDRAFFRLQDDPSFCSEGGRFGAPVCDWFVIGGRWSGYLRETILGKPYRAALAERFPKLTGRYSDSDVAPHHAALDALWREFGGDGPSPYNRDAYAEFGYDDDALAVDQTLHDMFIERYRDKADCDDGSCRFADLDGDEVSESFIGRKWLLIVDYHN